MPKEDDENAITYETFRKFQKKEKNNEKLQDLPGDFFRSCVRWLNRKEEEFEENRDSTLLHEIDNVKNIVKDIFNRRRKKVLLLALHSVRSKKVSENLLPEEEKFFENIVNELKELERDLLERVLEGEEPGTEGGKDRGEAIERTPEENEEAGETEEPAEGRKETEESEVEVKSLDERDGERDVQVEDGMKLVKVAKEVDGFVGPDEEFYGPLERGDIVTLPETVADLLIEEEMVEETGL